MTGIYAVMGHPVGHTLSPVMQNAAFRAAGWDALYVALGVTPDRLLATLRELHAAGIRGLNLTAPHKEAVWQVLVDTTGEAKSARAVNTLRRDERGWIGHATDGLGFDSWLREAGLSLRGARVLILGAGGAVRSIAPKIAALEPAAITLVSRNPERAGSVASWLRSQAAAIEVTSAALADGSAALGVSRWDVMVRALASGPVELAEAAWWGGLTHVAPVLELNYGPRAAESRARAATDGRRFEDGMGLLLHQGAHSFEFWTGTPAPLEAMREALAASRP